MVYNYFIMSISDWAGLILTALSIIAITVGGIRWFIQAEIKAKHEALIAEEKARIKAALGKSLS